VVITDLEPLSERAVVGAVRLEPLVDLDVVAELVLGDGPGTGVARPGEETTAPSLRRGGRNCGEVNQLRRGD
jgi:hypothetical protein